jgi:tRNA nucleotidyltransferase/poly(A) polymerase
MKRYKEYLVGGAVRDEILGLKSKDLDYVFVFDNIPDGTSSEQCFQEMTNIIKENGEIFLSTPLCYTIRYKDKISKEVKDVVMARKEIGYIPGTRTPIVIPGTLYDDLERRDFTLNALAKNDDGTIIDYFDGLKDLENKVLRTPLDCKVTFDDDPLRILRAIRFSITKDFIIPEEMFRVIMSYDYNKKMSVVSSERIREELFKCFKFDTLQALDTLNDFIPLRNYIFNKTKLWLKPTFEQFV